MKTYLALTPSIFIAERNTYSHRGANSGPPADSALRVWGWCSNQLSYECWTAEWCTKLVHSSVNLSMNG